MSDLIIITVFLGGAFFGVIATLIYWPWVELDSQNSNKKAETDA